MQHTIHFKDINNTTLAAVKRLLFLRNKTLPLYVDWKYGFNSPSGFRGVVAFVGEEEVGCFGSVPIKVRLSSDEIIYAGWFADWYVNPEFRGHGLGRALLDQLVLKNPFFFGHPGPRQALAICTAAGWQPLAFQAKIRWVLLGWPYYRRRTNFITKGLVKMTLEGLKQRYDRYIKSNFQRPTSNNYLIEMIFPDEMHQWMQSQPVVQHAQRTLGEWHNNDISIRFADDNRISLGEITRRITWVDPLNKLTVEGLRQFITAIRTENIAIVEMLVGTHDLYRICVQAGASRVNESPIICHGFQSNVLIPYLQGLHRENWLFRAAQI